QPKSGKSTLSWMLLARRHAGGTLAGRALQPGATVVICEENEEYWRQRRAQLDFGDDVAFFCQPFEGRRPKFDEWHDFIYSIAYLHDDRGVDLVILDPLAKLLPRGCENNADYMVDALLSLDPLQMRGMAILLLHHPNKWGAPDGRQARGTSALGGH